MPYADLPGLAIEPETRFERFHRDNPHIYRLFDRFAREVIAKGHRQFAARAIFHRIRWETMVVTTGEDFKINNNYSAAYARRWMQDNPEYEGFFRTRATRNDA